MPSRRMIDPKFWRSESMAQLTKMQRLLFLGLVSNADDQGRLRAHPALIRSDIFPFEDDPLDEIAADLDAIAGAGSIVLYEVDGARYIQIVNWWVYQRPKWAWPSRMPAPPDWVDRERYRVGNRAVKNNWDGCDWDGYDECDDGDDLPNDDPPNENGTGAEPERNQNGTTLEPERDENETVLEPERDGNESAAVSAPSGRTRTRTRTRTSGSEYGADAPAHPPPKKHSKGKQKKPTPDAVKVFRSNAHRYPPRAWYDDVERIVGDDPENLERWGRTVKAWVGMGWNPTNVKGMLDCFERGEMPGARQDNGGAPAAHGGNVAANLEAVDLWLEMTDGKP